MEWKRYEGGRIKRYGGKGQRKEEVLEDVTSKEKVEVEERVAGSGDRDSVNARKG